MSPASRSNQQLHLQATTSTPHIPQAASRKPQLTDNPRTHAVNLSITCGRDNVARIPIGGIA
jgi:hypothetical protein